ncbi:Uncharacterised protein [Metamycoplasma arthritidis]|uniref:Uncharacterized protein n=1 Tax=Metamycoplasma arthritidis (strain 158L3-1) TaxID=243272 RepID=B3PMB9_META1|nr:hypothetical protein [Metamycoplasma arthritidis]ACF07171.1 hypothetical protein MARTH_orf268 [Metamycoplasma arthritidis 158L3-1]VEU78695.1 Uncharacterised protein [Metamycoplasma arthritidis]
MFLKLSPHHYHYKELRLSDKALKLFKEFRKNLLSGNNLYNLKKAFVCTIIKLFRQNRGLNSKEENSISCEDDDKDDLSLLKIFTSFNKVVRLKNMIYSVLKNLYDFLIDEKNFDPDFWRLWKNEFLEDSPDDIGSSKDKKWYKKYYDKSTYYRKMNLLIRLMFWILFQQ